jgi:hypothetical protein
VPPLAMRRLCFTSTPESAAPLYRETTCQKEHLARDADFYMGHDPKVGKVTKSGREEHRCRAQAAAQSYLSNFLLGYSTFAVEEVCINEDVIPGTDTSDASVDG